MAAKQAKNHHFSTPLCSDFFPNVELCIMDKHLYFGLVGQEDIVPEVLLVHMQLCRPNQYFHILFREKRQTRGYSLAALSNKSHLFSLFLFYFTVNRGP